MISIAEVEACIKASLTDVEVTVSSDGRHYEAVVISSAFAGLSLLARHRRVYEALGDRMQADIHALSIRALTPTEAQGEQ